MKLVKFILSQILIACINIYKITLSPWLGGSCRFTPTCSTYCIEAIKKHGPFKGFYLSIKRVSSCQPWGREGYDPVP